MTYTLKKDLRTSWDLPPVNEYPLDSMEDDYDQDIYISERSSIVSSNDLSETIAPLAKRLPTPATSTLLSVPTVTRHSQNESLDNPSFVGIHHQQKEEKKIKKNDLRKVQLPQTNLPSVSERKSPEHGDSYFPSWYYYKSQNPAWILRQRQNQSYDTLDSSQHTHQPALTSSTIKPQLPKKTRHPHGHILLPNHDKQRFDPFDNNSSGSIHSNTHDNHEVNHSKRRSSPKHHQPQKEVDHSEHRALATKKPISQQQQRRKTKNDHDSIENHGPVISNNRSSQDSNSLMITSNSIGNRQKNRSKHLDKSSLVTDLDELNKSRHHPHPHPQNYTRSYHPPSIPSYQTQHHHNPLHVRRRPPSGSELHVVDVALRKTDRTSHIQQMRDPFHTSLTPITNQTLHLPMIFNDHHHHHHHHYQPKVYSPRFPTEYYGTLARQTHGKPWDEPSDTPRIYKPDVQTRFYDRYLHSIVDKRLAA